MQWQKQPPEHDAGSPNHHSPAQPSPVYPEQVSVVLVPLALHSKVLPWGNKLPRTVYGSIFSSFPPRVIFLLLWLLNGLQLKAFKFT